ncbi:MAG TPA: hypothetical protein VMN36_15725 [Verrucomicrobiales bacterium]|nr:hypothetical protein [Verrucomicrobiales bacterium]
MDCLSTSPRKRLPQRHGLEHRFALVCRFLKFRFGFGVVHPAEGASIGAVNFTGRSLPSDIPDERNPSTQHKTAEHKQDYRCAKDAPHTSFEVKPSPVCQGLCGLTLITYHPRRESVGIKVYAANPVKSRNADANINTNARAANINPRFTAIP